MIATRTLGDAAAGVRRALTCARPPAPPRAQTVSAADLNDDGRVTRSESRRLRAAKLAK